MKHTITLFEHQRLPLNAAQQAALDRIQYALPPKAFRWERNGVRWGSYCGLVPLGDTTLEILPKIRTTQSVKDGRESLLRMLATSHAVRLHETGDASTAQTGLTLLELFIRLYAERLQAVTQQGLSRQYLSAHGHLNCLRGKLLIEQQLRHNLAHRERLACQYDELSPDTLLNQVLLTALTELPKHCHSPQLRHRYMYS